MSTDAFVRALEEGIRREIAEADAVRAEIKARGIYWAGDEIWKLRRQVAALRRRSAELESRAR